VESCYLTRHKRYLLTVSTFYEKKIQMSPAEGAPEEFDQTIFPINHNRSIGPAEGLALNLVREAQRYSTIGI